jgi:hypothetical protein
MHSTHIGACAQFLIIATSRSTGDAACHITRDAYTGTEVVTGTRRP